MRENTYFGYDLQGLTLLLVAGAWLLGILLSSWLLLPTIALLLGAGTALLCLIPLWRDREARLIMLIVLWLLLGAWRFAIASPLGDPQAISSFIGTSKTLAVRGSVSDEPELTGRSRLLQVAVSSVSTDGGSSWQDAHGQLQVQILGTTLDTPYGPNYGDSVQLQGKLQPATPYTPTGVFASMAFPQVTVSASGGNPLLAALYHLRILLATVIEQALPQSTAATLIAILLSLRTPALRPLIPYFNVTGTAHLIASSGFKVTILAGLVMAATRWLYEGHEKQVQHLPAARRKQSWRRWLATSLVLASIFVYTVLSGAGPAAMRAGIMGALLVLAPRIGRTYNVYTALAATALLMSALDPFVLWNVGFQLSFLGTLGIVLLTPLFQRLLSPLEHLPAGHAVTEIIAVTLAAQTGTMPIIALTFNQISFIALLVNILTVPLLGVLIFLGMLICGAGLIFAPLGSIFAWAIWPLLWYVDTVVSVCAGLPGAYLPVQNLNSGLAWCYYGLLALLTSYALRRWPTPSPHGTQSSLLTYTSPTASTAPTAPASQSLLPTFPTLSKRAWLLMQLSAALLVILATGTTALAAQSNGLLTLTFLAVGPTGQSPQGQAILIRTSDGKTILIDGGPDATSLGAELDSRLPPWQRSLDMVILTSSRTDHLTGLQDIVTRYQIGEVLDAGMLHPNAGYALWRRTISQRNLQYVQVRQGTTVPIGAEVSLQIFWPASPLHKSSSEELDDSLVIRLIAPGLRVLFLGAAAMSKYALSELLSTVAPTNLQADVVQMMGETGKAFPAQLASLLQETHYSQLLITPAALTPRQRKAGATPVIASLPPGVAPDMVLQTAQVGTLAISSDGNRWSVNANTT